MLEVGKIYDLNVRNGLAVEIVGTGVDTSGDCYTDQQGEPYKGRFFVGITRNDRGPANDPPGDWVASYDSHGRRLWEVDGNQGNRDWDLIL